MSLSNPPAFDRGHCLSRPFLFSISILTHARRLSPCIPPSLPQRLTLDMSTSKAHRDWSTQSFLVLTRKYPEQAVQVFHKLTKETQTRLVRDHPTLQASMPRHTRRSSSNSSSMTSPSPSSSRVAASSSPSTLSASKRQPGSAAAAAAAAAATGAAGGEGGRGPRAAKASSSASQQELHQKLLKYKLENNPRFKDAALQAALVRQTKSRRGSRMVTATSSHAAPTNHSLFLFPSHPYTNSIHSPVQWPGNSPRTTAPRPAPSEATAWDRTAVPATPTARADGPSRCYGTS